MSPACPTVRSSDRVRAPARLHVGDTTVPVLASCKTDTGRLWVYVRYDRPVAGPEPPAAVFHYSRDRRGEHPQAHLRDWTGVLQADAYGGYGELYAAARVPGPVLEAGCWAHARRKFFELADLETAAHRKAKGEKAQAIYPLALEAVQRIDALFAVERQAAGLPPAQRLAIRQELGAPRVAELERWMRDTGPRLSRGHDIAQAIGQVQRHWTGFPPFPQGRPLCPPHHPPH